MDDRNYWNKFYKENKDVNLQPSSFAEFCQQWITGGEELIELGCGNGRDSIYFSNRGCTVTSIDNARESIRELQEKHPEIKSICMDIRDIDSLENSYEVIYSRFFLHSIDDEDEDKLLAWAYKSLAPRGVLLIEARTTKDKSVKKVYEGHFRRYTDTQKLQEKLLSLGFDIFYFIESQGLSVYHTEDPFLVRVVAQKITEESL